MSDNAITHQLSTNSTTLAAAVDEIGGSAQKRENKIPSAN